jgi:hypothetical protein
MLLALVPWFVLSVSESPDTLYVPLSLSVVEGTLSVQLQPPPVVVQVPVSERPASASAAAVCWKADWSWLQVAPWVQLEGITSVSAADSVILTV